MDNSKRKNGFYWLQLYENSEWIVGYWNNSFWVLPGISTPNLDESIYDIFGDTPISQPQTLSQISINI